MKYKLTIAYDGTHYSGWQIQPNAISIQEQIQNALQLLLKETTWIIGSGRTDAGVHALAQTAHFSTKNPFDCQKILKGLNGVLPKDIRIKALEEVPQEFHARYSAQKKTYYYYIHLNPVLDPHIRLYRLHLRRKIDLSLLVEATKLFLGKQDFTSFANEANKGSAAHAPVKNLMRLDVCQEQGGLRLEFEADGFLYKMVRNITGTLLEVATKKIPLQAIPEIFAAKDRSQAAAASPACALFLANVVY